MEQAGKTTIDTLVSEETSPVVRLIMMHFCESDHPTFGSIVEWCESRGDCQQAVQCPHCGMQFVLDDDEFDELRAIAVQTGDALSCGVTFD